MKIAIGGDHGSIHLKQKIIQLLQKEHEIEDFGTFTEESCDYSDFAYLAAKSVVDGKNERAIVICSTGIGVSISANKVAGIRCALVTSLKQAQLTRDHNNTNVLALGVVNTSDEVALEIVKIWIDTPFSNDERHVRRIKKIEALGKDYTLYHSGEYVVGMSLKNVDYLENNNMALYTAENEESVIENRKRLFSLLNQPLENAILPNQTHSNHVVKVNYTQKGSVIDDCDAMYTFDNDVVLGVFHADCVPVYVFDSKTKCIAIAHCSEKAVENGLVENFITTLSKEIDLFNAKIYIGPGVSTTKQNVPLRSLVKEKLVNYSTMIIDEFTDLDEKYFSFKLNDHERHLSFIYRK